MKKFTKKKKIWRVLSIMLPTLLLIVIALVIVGKSNAKNMNACADAAMATLEENHSLIKLDNPKYDVVTIKGMTFYTEHYKAEGIGHVAVMKLDATVMQMLTIVVTPTEKNIPLMSVDYIYMPGMRKAYVEYYDLVDNKDETYMFNMDKLDTIRDAYSDLPDTQPTSGWYDDLITVATYKKGGKDTQLLSMLTDNLNQYLQIADELPILSFEEQESNRAITQDYTDKLVDLGGVATNQFKAELGAEATREFLDTVLFGTEID